MHGDVAPWSSKLQPQFPAPSAALNSDAYCFVHAVIIAVIHSSSGAVGLSATAGLPGLRRCNTRKHWNQKTVKTCSTLSSRVSASVQRSCRSVSVEPRPPHKLVHPGRLSRSMATVNVITNAQLQSIKDKVCFQRDGIVVNRNVQWRYGEAVVMASTSVCRYLHRRPQTRASTCCHCMRRVESGLRDGQTL